MVLKKIGLTAVFVCLALLSACGAPPKEAMATYTVRFGDSEWLVDSGGEIAEPEAPKREHAVFAGWYLDETLLERAVFPFRVRRNTVFYAKWKNAVYVVRFDGLAVPAEYGEKLDAPADPERAHFTFSGWYSDEALEIPAVFPYFVTGDAAIYAKWEPVRYRVRFGDEERTAVYGESVAAPEAENRPGQTFAGWYLDADCSLPAAFPYTVEKDVTFYPNWTPKTYRVCFAELSEEVLPYGTEIAAKLPPERAHFLFAGWYLDEERTSLAVFPFTVSGDTVFFAKWERKKYRVIFRDDSEAELAYGAEILPPADPEREGYGFTGWYYDEDCTSRALFPLYVEETITFYAGWTRVTHAVTFTGWGMENVPDGACIGIVPTPKKEGMTFAGWLDAGTGLSFDFAATPIVKPMTFTPTFATEGLTFENGAVSGGQDPGAETVEIPAYFFGVKVTKIADSAFYDAAVRKGWSMTAVCLPDTLEEIGSGAFQRCSRLSDLVLPSGVEVVGADAFARCGALSHVHCRAAVRPDGIPADFVDAEFVCVEWNCACRDENGFRFAEENGGAKVTQYLGGKAVAEVPATLGALPVTEIGTKAFWYADLTEAILPETVRALGADAFGGNGLMTKLTVLSVTPPALNGSIVESPDQLAVFVPRGVSAAYRASDWSIYTIAER